MLLSVSSVPDLTDWTDHRLEFDEVLKLAHRPSLSAGGTLLVDARPASSYKDGHIPTSLLLDFPSSLLQDPGKFTYLRDPEELKNHIAKQLGQDKLDQIVSGQVTVVNSEFYHYKKTQSCRAQALIAVLISLRRWPVGSDKLVVSPITRSRLSTL